MSPCGEDDHDAEKRDLTGVVTDPAYWSGCPAIEDFANDPEGTVWIDVTDEAFYCTTFREDSTLKEALERKALLRVTPGCYTLPDGGGNDVGLPFCLGLGEDAEAIGVDVGLATHIKFLPNGDRTFEYSLQQPVTTPEGLQFRASQSHRQHECGFP
ncbi:MAG: hypothetical protein JXA30_22820 [Deltaproteobacteria bacterium]|nr:hypothetical protein [Deltaproteobacteria bacterium]